MIIQIGDKQITTKYDIGDVVTVYEYGYPLKQEMSTYYLDEKDENGYNKTEDRPVQYTIEDIKLDCRSGNYTYSLSYSNARCIFPCGSRGAIDEYIIEKVKDEDIYKDPSYSAAIAEELDLDY